MKIEDVLKRNDAIEYLASKGVSAKYSDKYILLKYKNLSEGVDIFDEAVRECRGLIIKRDTFEIVCRPFKKWFNVQEEYADEIDWNSAKVYEKIDGSLIKLWYDEEWHWSTMGAIDAADATAENITYADLIKKAKNYNDIDLESLDKELTYLFELVSLQNQVVIAYKRPMLYHIGTRQRNGEELVIDIGVQKPKEFPLSSLEECLKAAESLNQNEVTDEGFVVVDKDFNRIKIKSPKYVLYHRMWNNGAIKKADMVSIILEGGLRSAMGEFPLLREELLKTNAEIAMLEYEFETIIQDARQYFEEYETRAVAAEFIKKTKFPAVGFWALDHEGYAEDFIRSKDAKYIQKCLQQVEL